MEKYDEVTFVHAGLRGLWDIQGEVKTAGTRAEDTDLSLHVH